jgi:hypothetical protein
MKVNFPQIFENIIVCGDIHGDIMPLMFKVSESLKLQNSLIIVAGDVGLGFHADGYYLDLFSRAAARLKKRNNFLCLVRGNHDDPDKWNDYEPFKDYWQDGDANIRLIKDYTVITAITDRKEHNILCVGGALSIDRAHRTEGKNYWPTEPFVYDESKVEGLIGITDVVTHSAPHFCEPILKTGIQNWKEHDNKIEADCEKERQDHTLLYNKLKEKNKIEKWFYGHFHFSNKTYIDDTQFNLCAIMELVPM